MLTRGRRRKLPPKTPPAPLSSSTPISTPKSKPQATFIEFKMAKHQTGNKNKNSLFFRQTRLMKLQPNLYLCSNLDLNYLEVNKKETNSVIYILVCALFYLCCCLLIIAQASSSSYNQQDFVAQSLPISSNKYNYRNTQTSSNTNSYSSNQNYNPTTNYAPELYSPPSQQQQQIFSCGKLFYRTLHLDANRDSLYVGAMDNVFKLNLANINKTHCVDDAIRLEPSDTQKCVSKGKNELYDCRNHIKVILPMDSTSEKLYVCGTNAYSPRHYALNATNWSTLNESPLGTSISAQAECPFDPDDNSTALWAKSGNPFDAPALYTGAVTELSKADAIIFRSELFNSTSGAKLHDAKRSVKYDSKWLDRPNFVGSFEVGDFVYFFFRESAVEYINCGKSIYSRVARVCKRDMGFKQAIQEKVWTSFLKARLNCSIPGEFPFYFDEIQSIYKNPADDKKFHAVFTTSTNGLTGSAICSFSLDSINEAFNGKFKEQQSSTSAWLPVPTSASYVLKEADVKPGGCVDDSRLLNDNLVSFVRGHPLMDSAVANDNNKPVFFRRQIMFTKIVVDVVEFDGVRYTVYFVGTNTGHVYKIVEWPLATTPTVSLGSPFNFDSSPASPSLPPTSNGFTASLDVLLSSKPSSSDSSSLPQQQQQQPQLPSQQKLDTQAALVEIIEATVPLPVLAMELSQRHKSLYVSSESFIKQVPLQACKVRHDNCVQCVRDPYCGWDRRAHECRAFSSSSAASYSLRQDVANEQPDICHAAVRHKDVFVNQGQAVHLPCPFKGLVQDFADLNALLAAQQRQLARADQLQFASTTGVLINDQQHHNPSLAPIVASAPLASAASSSLQQTVGGIAYDASALAATSAATSIGSNLSPSRYISWHFHRRDSGFLVPGYPVLQRKDKFVLAADNGLVILNAEEPGIYQCRLGTQVIHRYNLIIDSKTCSPPQTDEDFKAMYVDWCKERQRHKQAYQAWHAKQNRCLANQAT